jgi:hypothetical protein
MTFFFKEEKNSLVDHGGPHRGGKYNGFDKKLELDDQWRSSIAANQMCAGQLATSQRWTQVR